MAKPLSADQIQQYAKDFESDPQHRVARNAVSTTSITAVALDREVVTSIDHSVSNLLDDWKVTNQKQSGRCWLFAGLNLLRASASRTLGVKDFEFSQNYLLFWDKLEKANHYLEAIISTADRDIDDRTIAHLMSDPTSDGGQWNMFTALVAKHGLVPKAAMPETESSSSTRALNAVLRRLLRQATRDLRATAVEGDSAVQARKEEILLGIHRVLTIHLGAPPERFLWQWADKDRGFHREGWMTPQEFAARYAGDIEEYVCLVNDPRESSPFGQTYTVEFLGNVVGAPPVTYLNVEMDLLKALAMETIVDGEPVWFGCDVGQMCNPDLGLWDANLYDYAGLYQLDFDLDKAQRLVHHESLMTHAMLFTGVDVVDGGPRRWRVENSWGDEKADQGFYTMNDSWFGQYVYEIAVRKNRLPAKLLEAFEREPIVLPAWDPMGALAR